MTNQPTTTPIEDAIAALYAAGRPDLAAAVRHQADHRFPTATDWVDPSDGNAYPLDTPLTDGLGDDWTHAGWATYLDGRRPVPLMRLQDSPTACLITDLIDANCGALTAALADTDTRGIGERLEAFAAGDIDEEELDL